MQPAERVAVIGASGIGKHHARWLCLEGAEVVAIVGSSQASAQATAHGLHELFGFSGRAYGSVKEMLRTERPELVSIASPPGFHAEHAMQCIQAGAHVVCEKPLVFDQARSLDALLAEAEAVILAAERAERKFVLMTQYVALVPTLMQIAEISSGPETSVWQFGMKMESARREGGAEYENVWIDLGPHPIAVLLALTPAYGMVEGSLNVEIQRFETRVAFDQAPIHDRASPAQQCNAEIIVGKTEKPERWVEVNGLRVQYEGRPYETGAYCACIRVGDAEVMTEDPMQLTFRWILASCAGQSHGPLIEGCKGLEALEMLFRVLR